MKKLLFLSAIAMLASGCVTHATSRYASSTANVNALRDMHGNPLNVGAFSATIFGQKEIWCGAPALLAGPIRTEDGKPFAEFVRNAFLDELKIANVYSLSAPISITGNLDSIDFSIISGKWDMALTVNSSNGKSMSVSESYAFTWHFSANTACNHIAQAFMPAVQDLVGKVVRSPEFATLVSQ